MEGIMDQNKQKVLIRIKGITKQEGESEEEIVELVTQGEMYKKRKSDYIIYKESQVSGLEGTTTTVKIEGEKISIIRLGTMNSHMTFEKGKKSYNMYSTPYGDMTLGICTKDISINYNQEHHPTNIYVDYNVEIQGLMKARNILDIQLKH